MKIVDAPPSAPLPGYTLVWSDEFDGDKLDLAKGVYRTDNNHRSTQRPENVALADGKLVLRMKIETDGDTDHAGAGIISRKTFRYGYFEAALKIWEKTIRLMNRRAESRRQSRSLTITTSESLPAFEP